MRSLFRNNPLRGALATSCVVFDEVYEGIRTRTAQACRMFLDGVLDVLVDDEGANPVLRVARRTPHFLLELCRHKHRLLGVRYRGSGAPMRGFIPGKFDEFVNTILPVIAEVLEFLPQAPARMHRALLQAAGACSSSNPEPSSPRRCCSCRSSFLSTSQLKHSRATGRHVLGVNNFGKTLAQLIRVA